MSEDKSVAFDSDTPKTQPRKKNGKKDACDGCGEKRILHNVVTDGITEHLCDECAVARTEENEQLKSEREKVSETTKTVSGEPSEPTVDEESVQKPKRERKKKSSESKKKELKVPHFSSRAEGMFTEKTFEPRTIAITSDEHGERLFTLLNVQAEELMVNGDIVQRKLAYYLRKFTKFKGLQTVRPMLNTKSVVTEKVGETQVEREVWTPKTDAEVQTILQSALDKSVADNKPIKLRFLFDKHGNCLSVASMKHSQIPSDVIRDIVEVPLKKRFGENLVKVEQGIGRTAYEISTKLNGFKAYAVVDVGNNLALGRSGIRIFAGLENRSQGENMRPCMNWCNLIPPIADFYKVPTESLPSIVEMIGSENVEHLQERVIHMRSTAANLSEVQESIEKQVELLETAINSTSSVLNEAVKFRLTKAEMDTILYAYALKVGVPEYLRTQILENVKDVPFEHPSGEVETIAGETFFGFWNAVTWVSTHGTLKKEAKDFESQSIIRKLRNIGGDVLFRAPTFRAIQERVGELTPEKLGLPSKPEKKVKEPKQQTPQEATVPPSETEQSHDDSLR
jgi:hypothetical protein